MDGREGRHAVESRLMMKGQAKKIKQLQDRLPVGKELERNE